MPIVARGFVDREQARVDGQLDALALAGLEVGFRECAKTFRRFPPSLLPVCRRHINLRDALTLTLADIVNCEGGADRSSICLRGEAGQREARVAEAVSKGEQWP